MKPFWKERPLSKLNREEWESLCDSCGKCCLQKLEDEDTGDVFFTNVVCNLLDLTCNRCTQYQERSRLVPTCVTLTLDDLLDPYYLPSTCAYRLLAEGQDLPAWHPLMSGDADTVERSGNSIRGRVVVERDADDWEHHLIDWIN